MAELSKGACLGNARSKALENDPAPDAIADIGIAAKAKGWGAFSGHRRKLREHRDRSDVREGVGYALDDLRKLEKLAVEAADAGRVETCVVAAIGAVIDLLSVECNCLWGSYTKSGADARGMHWTRGQKEEEDDAL